MKDTLLEQLGITLEKFENLYSRDKFVINCKECNCEIIKIKQNILRSIKEFDNDYFYCSPKCRRDELKPNVNCEKCNKSFYKAPGWLKRGNRHFCSKSCASSVLKRKTEKHCKICNNFMDRRRIDICQKCSFSIERNRLQNLTLKELHEKNSVKGKHPSWANAELRNYCRAWNKHLSQYSCQKCKYSLHIEYCHIKPVSSFNENTKLKEINDESNILILCPNCHWEFDNELLSVNDIPPRTDVISNYFVLDKVGLENRGDTSSKIIPKESI